MVAEAAVRQATLAAPFHLSGPGLHTGVDSIVAVHPAPVDAGLAFVIGGHRVPALAEFARESELATVLTDGEASVSTVEHVLSALFACGITNAEIHVDGPEIPILDGTARLYIEQIGAVGTREFDAPAASLTLDEPLEFRDGDRAVIMLPYDGFRVRFVADYAAPIGTQYFSLDVTPQTYAHELADARTFGFLRDVDAMRARGLARGGTLENALVYDEDGPMTPLRYDDEVVRHKLLDLIGDFALLGARPQCEIIAIKSGHAMHARVTRALRGRIRA